MEPKFIQKLATPGGKYEVYQAADAESAKEFLQTKTVSEPNYYIVVETPEGSWGIDKEGLYLEKLLPWQTDIGLAKVKGTHNPLSVKPFSLQTAANRISDNFVIEVTCGECGQSWQDGIRYQDTTVVRCPKCKTYNSIDSGNIMVFLKE